MLEENAKAAARNCLQDSQSRLGSVLRAGSLGRCQTSRDMSFGGRVSGAESALLFRFRPAHRAANRQYASQRELLGFHTNIIQHRQSKRWSILLLGVSIRPKTGIYLERISLAGDFADDQPSMVETSPASTPASLAFRKRRRIFPDLVLGKEATNSNDEGVAIGPSSRRTCSISAADSASEAT